jgi:hypothetical protein
MSEQRLIDAEALEEKAICGGNLDIGFVRLKDVVNAPTIDPESLRPHGRWVNRPKTCVFTCSVCGREVRAFHTSNMAMSQFPYCHCGARMDGC